MENIQNASLEWDEVVTPFPWMTFGLSMLSLFLFVPVCNLLMKIRILWGGSSYAPNAATGLVLSLVGFSVAAYALLVWPMAQLVYPQISSKWNPGRRILSAVFLISLPLLSYAYFVGNFKEAIHWHQAFMATVPPVALGAFLFEISPRLIVFAAPVALGVGVSLFYLGDLLGPFSTFIALASNGPFFYWAQIVSMALSFCILGVSLSKLIQVSERMIRRSYQWGLAALTAHFFFVQYIGPLVAKFYQPTLSLGFDPTNLAWVGYVATIYFLNRENAFGKKAILALAFCELGSLFLWVSLSFFERDASWMGLSWLVHRVLALVLFGFLVRSVSKFQVSV